jgi:hypothetical protein
MSPSDAFCSAFDSIEVDPARAPSRLAIERAMEFCAPAPRASEPGFYLLDDAGGRFVIDRDWGLVSLKDAAVLAREPGAVHGARLHVVEPSGASYQLNLKLRLTGLIPQMLGGEENDFLLGA